MDIHESLSVIQTFYKIANISQWTVLERKNWRLGLSKILILYTWFVIFASLASLIYGFFNDFDINQTSNNDIGEMVDFIQMVGIRIAHLVCIIEALIRAKEEIKFYGAIREIDRIFECTLNVDVDNKKFRRNALQRGTIMLILYIGSEIFILVIKLLTTKSNFSVFWILYMFPFIVCGLRYFQIFNSILIIKNRFDKLTSVLNSVNLLNSTAKNIYDEPETIEFISKDLLVLGKVDNLNRRISMENPELRRLLTIREIYNRLWELNCIVNRCFGVSMLISVANDFISITSNCYWIFLNFKEYSSTLIDFLQIAGSAVWSIPHLFNVLVLAIICEKTIKSTTNIALGLHSIKMDLLNDNHNTLIEQFSMQLLHQKLTFTAAGFFNVDCSLLYTIVGATTTYLIILIQFHMSEQNTIPKT